jgi:hypothetical protein
VEDLVPVLIGVLVIMVPLFLIWLVIELQEGIRARRVRGKL